MICIIHTFLTLDNYSDILGWKNASKITGGYIIFTHVLTHIHLLCMLEDAMSYVNLYHPTAQFYSSAILQEV